MGPRGIFSSSCHIRRHQVVYPVFNRPIAGEHGDVNRQYPGSHVVVGKRQASLAVDGISSPNRRHKKLPLWLSIMTFLSIA